MIYYRNGKFAEDSVQMNLSQPGFRTGYGFFETLAWNGHKVCHLDLHLKRARASLREFNIIEEVLDYEKIINEVVEANALKDSFARVNIFFPVESGKTAPIVTAVLFEHVSDRVWSLMPAKDVFLTGLMRHKSMNRMDYLNAWQTAQDSGFDDALLLDFEGRVLETSFASLLFKKGNRYIEPQTEYKLAGTTQTITDQHLKIESEPVFLESVHEFDHVFALNSLGGMSPVSAIGDVVFETEHKISQKITKLILELN
ncbi:aminotransferase class IV [Maridesulfovibrio ferrireducens]|uniref:aminotransferase class IV n=1 Tax=Maridesulfovibrio ferrireducens TaxID=246191 RepID=UPI001A22B5F8|nr:aminotransferase class IV [Maridesulfovibrio ferrireducens]MBI9110890.1 aminotransferase class IV [Maridesulfovibrio ferrireducens]